MKFLLSGIFHTGSSRRFTVAISRPNSFFQSLRATRQRLECAASRRFSSIAGKSPPFFTQALHASTPHVPASIILAAACRELVRANGPIHSSLGQRPRYMLPGSLYFGLALQAYLMLEIVFVLSTTMFVPRGVLVLTSEAAFITRGAVLVADEAAASLISLAPCALDSILVFC